MDDMIYNEDVEMAS